MSPKKGTISIGTTSSNQWFSGRHVSFSGEKNSPPIVLFHPQWNLSKRTRPFHPPGVPEVCSAFAVEDNRRVLLGTWQTRRLVDPEAKLPPNKIDYVTLNPQISYCWWTKSCTTKDDDYPIIYRVLTIPGGAGFCPSTVGTLPETKIAPENRPSQKETRKYSNHPFSCAMLVGFEEGIPTISKIMVCKRYLRYQSFGYFFVRLSTGIQ